MVDLGLDGNNFIFVSILNRMFGGYDLMDVVQGGLLAASREHENCTFGFYEGQGILTG